jgi:hypothetical protein
MSTTFTGATTTGNILICAVARSAAGTGGVNTVAQVYDGVNKWKQIVENTYGNSGSGGQGTDLWICESCSNTTPTVTVQLTQFPISNVLNMNMWIAEYQAATSGYELIDGFGTTSSASGTPPTSATVSTNYSVQSGDLLITSIAGSTAGTATGYTPRAVNGGSSFFVSDAIAGSTGIASAAWTGLSVVPPGAALAIAAIRPVGATTGPNLLQSLYWEPGVGSVNFQSWTIPAYAVNPTAGNTLLCIVTGARYHNLVSGHIYVPGTASLSDTAGNTWTKIGDIGTDVVGGGCWTLFVCNSALGGATTVTALFNPGGGVDTPSAGLFEFAHLTPAIQPLHLNRQGREITGSSTSVSTSGDVATGDMGVSMGGWLFGGGPPQTTPPTPGQGWRLLASDTNGGGFHQYLGSTVGGSPLTATLGSPLSASHIDLGVFALGVPRHPPLGF